MSVLQLSSLGSQDTMLLSSGALSFFKTLYKRHTNFAVESIENQFQNTANFSTKPILQVSRQGDGILYAYLTVTIPALTDANTSVTTAWQGWVNTVGYAMIKEVNFSVGGVSIDKHPGEWLDADTELCVPPGKRYALNKSIGRTEGTSEPARFNATAAQTLFIPMRFFWNKGPGMMLPMIALQNHEVKLEFDFRPANELIRTNTAATAVNVNMTSPSVWIDYILLDRPERVRFAQYSHEYLIETVQYVGHEAVPASVSTYKPRLNFNHPTKELVWMFRSETRSTANSATGNDWFNYDGLAASAGQHPFQTMRILFNGSERLAEKPAAYFHQVQQLQHHTNTTPRKIYSYSFALFPEEHQPSGSSNFSRLDQVHLFFKMEASNPAYQLLVFAKSYNVFRVMGGMGGLGFAS